MKTGNIKYLEYKLITAFFVVASLFQYSSAQYFTVADSAFDKASESNRSILLIFTGSDWCPPCVRMEKKIFRQTVFEEFAENDIVVLMADFPRNKNQPPSEKDQNETLASQFNPEGVFPKIVLLNSDGLFLQKIEYTNEKVDEFIEKLNRVISLPQ